jgi:hypothetical protein
MAQRDERRTGSPDWRWCLKMGLAIVLVDLVTLALSEGQAPDSELRAFLQSIDQVANILLFSWVGYRTGQATGRATAAAEAGVVASLLPAAAAALYQIFQPGLGGPADETGLPLINRVVGSIAFNVVLGGISAWFAGWLARRGRAAAR